MGKGFLKGEFKQKGGLTETLAHFRNSPFLTVRPLGPIQT